MIRGLCGRAAALAAGLGGAAREALAQAAGSDASQSVLPRLKTQPPLLAWGLAAAFLVGALAIAFKASRRGGVN